MTEQRFVTVTTAAGFPRLVTPDNPGAWRLMHQLVFEFIARVPAPDFRLCA